MTGLQNNKKDLLAWLEEHNAKLMWWKEFLHHEGSGKRTPEEKEEARKRYENAVHKLSQEYAEKRKDQIYQWMQNGMSLRQAEKKWDQLGRKTYEDSRREYAYQKD